MSSGRAPDVDLSLPDLELELLEDLSPAGPQGFLRLLRRRLRVRLADGSQSPPFIYDEIDRRAVDAVVLAAHFERDGERWVYLRSALRPPLWFRNPESGRAPAHERAPNWELPAGLIEPEEPGELGVLRAARRELLEELGFEANEADFRALGPAGWPCPGVLAGKHFFLHIEVQPEARKEPALDGSVLERFGRVLALPLSKALEFCRSGEINDVQAELGLRRLAEIVAVGPHSRSDE
jgi:8-oxo-dGTP pyrophosphatase MutT (NUDIX family)